MLELSDLNVDYKIAPPESMSIIGSNSIATSGDLYVVNFNSIAKENNRQNKRMLDLALCLVFLLLSPFLIGFVNQRTGFFRNIGTVLLGRKSWVGYCSGNQSHLPHLKAGVLSPASLFSESISDKKKDELNILYAKNYRLINDLEIVWKAWRNTGKS